MSRVYITTTELLQNLTDIPEVETLIQCIADNVAWEGGTDVGALSSLTRQQLLDAKRDFPEFGHPAMLDRVVAELDRVGAISLYLPI